MVSVSVCVDKCLSCEHVCIYAVFVSDAVSGKQYWWSLHKLSVHSKLMFFAIFQRLKCFAISK